MLSLHDIEDFMESEGVSVEQAKAPAKRNAEAVETSGAARDTLSVDTRKGADSRRIG